MAASRSLTLGAVCFTMFASGLASSEARACSPYQCQPTTLSPPDASWVSTDVPAFLVMPRLWSVPGEPSFAADQFGIESQGGTAVPFHLVDVDGLKALVLDAPLAKGTWYYLRYPEYCPSYQYLDPPLRLARYFQALNDYPLPTEAPTIYPGSHQVEPLRVSTSSGSCTTEVQADVFRFSVGDSGQISWATVSRVETLVDGEHWALTLPGLPDSQGDQPLDVASAIPGVHRPTVLFSRCGERVPGDDAGLTPGEHQVEVRYLVYGAAAQIPPATFTVTMGCPDAPGDAAPEQSDVPEGAVPDASLPDALAADSPASPEADVLDSTPADVPDAVPELSSQTSSGCDAGPPGPSQWVTLAVAGCVLAFLQSRRTRDSKGRESGIVSRL